MYILKFKYAIITKFKIDLYRLQIILFLTYNNNNNNRL